MGLLFLGVVLEVPGKNLPSRPSADLRVINASSVVPAVLSNWYGDTDGTPENEILAVQNETFNFAGMSAVLIVSSKFKSEILLFPR